MRSARPCLVLAVPLAIFGYALVALGSRWWLSSVVATSVAVLLWRRHARARFAAYVLLSAMAVRGSVFGPWPVAAFALVVILALQLPPALAAWPRLRPGLRQRSGASSREPV